MVCINSQAADMESPDLPVIPTLTTIGHGAKFLREREDEIARLTDQNIAIIGLIPGVSGTVTHGVAKHYAKYFATCVRAAREQGTVTQRMHSDQGEHPMTRSLDDIDISGLCTGS